MQARNITIPLSLAVCLACCANSTTHGDVLRFHSGSEIRGQLISSNDVSSPKEASASARMPGSVNLTTIETLSGIRIEVSTAAVAFVTRRPLGLEEYEVRARNCADLAEDHWELALWCKAQRLTTQYEQHCERAIELDPEHEPAHRALGHVWKEDRWVDLDVYMTERGYVKHKGRWITQQESELLEKTSAELSREQEWYPKIRVWVGWVTGNHVDRAQKGLQAFQSLEDADAAPAILRLMAKHPAHEVRLLAVETLGRMTDPKSAAALSQIVVTDADPVVSRTALEKISASHYPLVQGYFIQKLRSAENSQVNRAATALARVGDQQAITPLINALVTSHLYQVRVSGAANSTYSFGTDGSFGTPNALPPGIEIGLRTGQFPDGVVVLNSPFGQQNLNARIVTVKQEQQNPEVLSALQKLTTQSFAYDERTWHLWWTAQQHQGGLGKS